MEILEIRTLRGPNYWSGYWKKLIIMRIDIGVYEKKPTGKIKGFYERMVETMPSLITHGCSYQEEGGFLRRVKESTWAGHVIEHFALELQTLAGMDTGYGRTRETGEKGIYNVVFSYLEEEENRDIPYIRLNDQSLVQLGYGVNQKRIQATTTVNTNMISVDIAGNKHATKKLLGDMGVPVPKGYRIREIDELEDTVQAVGYPVVIKPLDGNHGKGATVGIKTIDDARTAFEKAKEYSRYVIVEKQLIGSDFRALGVNNRLIAGAKRVPAHVKGDGKLTIHQLIDKTNEDPRRGYGHENVLTEIDVDGQTLRCISRAGYTLDTVLKKGEILHLKTTANISTGGTEIGRAHV